MKSILRSAPFPFPIKRIKGGVSSTNPSWIKVLLILCCLINFVAADTFGDFTDTDNGANITITDYPTTAVGVVEIPATIIDDDGLSDGAEVNTHETLPKVADTDGDGFLDLYEVLAGKSPFDILDKPALVADARTAIEFTFPSALGKSYRIESPLDLLNWTFEEDGIAGSGVKFSLNSF